MAAKTGKMKVSKFDDNLTGENAKIWTAMKKKANVASNSQWVKHFVKLFKVMGLDRSLILDAKTAKCLAYTAKTFIPKGAWTYSSTDLEGKKTDLKCNDNTAVTGWIKKDTQKFFYGGAKYAINRKEDDLSVFVASSTKAVEVGAGDKKPKKAVLAGAKIGGLVMLFQVVIENYEGYECQWGKQNQAQPVFSEVGNLVRALTEAYEDEE